MPFAALRDPETHRFLLEAHPIVMSPSATLFATRLARGRDLARGEALSALLVGNPELGAGSGLRPLPGSAQEVAAAADLYPRHVVLTGREATKRRFVDAAPEYDVVHFGGHALLNAEYPLLSRLVFSSGDGRDQPDALFAHEIARLRMPRTQVVVLAACSTGAGAVSRGEGVMSIARPFLAAGVPVVIASQWDVDDLATDALFRAFHRAFAASRDPIGALREAQLSLLRGSNGAYASPAHWAAFVALGTVVPQWPGSSKGRME